MPIKTPSASPARRLAWEARAERLRSAQPNKPEADDPLWIHLTGYWCMSDIGRRFDRDMRDFWELALKSPYLT